MMKVSEQGLELIRTFEGCRLSAYQCSAGRWTIGYGHTGEDVVEGLQISQARATDLLMWDVNQVLKLLRAEIRVPLRQCQLDALVSLGYNIGVNALRKSTLLRLVNRNPEDLNIHGEFERWIHSSGEVVPGLVRRRKAEAKLYFSG
ncbi:MAG: lysozyme [Bacteroidales bacterium]